MKGRFLGLCSIVLAVSGLVGIAYALIFSLPAVLIVISILGTGAGILGIVIWIWKKESDSN
jgi:hypothetical protein